MCQKCQLIFTKSLATRQGYSHFPLTDRKAEVSMAMRITSRELVPELKIETNILASMDSCA